MAIIKSKKKVRVGIGEQTTEAGIVLPKVEVQTKQPYYAKQHDSDSYAVVSESGEIARIYSTKGDFPVDDPKGCAEEYAKNLSGKWR